MMDRKMVNYVKEQYPPGTRIRLNSMDDPYAPIAPGTEGEVDFVDDIGIEMELPLHAGQKIDETCTAIASDERVSFAVELCEQ